MTLMEASSLDAMVQGTPDKLPTRRPQGHEGILSRSLRQLEMVELGTQAYVEMTALSGLIRVTKDHAPKTREELYKMWENKYPITFTKRIQ